MNNEIGQINKLIRIQCYYGKNGQIIIFPFVRNINGISKMSSQFFILNSQYSHEEMVNATASAWEISDKNLLESDYDKPAWYNASGIKGYKTFTKRYPNMISVCYCFKTNSTAITPFKIDTVQGGYIPDERNLIMERIEINGVMDIETIVKTIDRVGMYLKENPSD